MDVAGARYAAVKTVDLEQTVDDLTAHWVFQAKLDIEPSLVTLWLVKCGAHKPAPEDETKELDDPRLTLAEAGITDGCSLQAHFAGVAAGNSQKELMAAVTSLTETVAALADRISVTQRDLLDPWDGLNTSEVSSRNRSTFAKKVVEYYYGDKKAVATCMITGEAGSAARPVVCAHIWPYCSHGKGLEKLGLRHDDVHSASNSLMLLEVIEEAFYAKRVAFEYCCKDDTFLLRVVDPTLLEGTVYGARKFSALEGRPVRLPEEAHGRVVEGRAVFPFRRLLAWHFSHALQKALDLNWRDMDYLQPYFEMSSSNKVSAWLQGNSPGAKWLGQRAVGIFAIRATQAGSAASSGEE